MPTFNSITDLFKYVKKEMADVLANEIADEVRGEMRQSIYREVYSVYQPVEYQRRTWDGGLIAEENTHSSDAKNLTLTVENVTPFSQSPPSGNTGPYLAELVEYGHGVRHKYEHLSWKGEYLRPRRFVQATRDKLATNGRLRDRMRDGLANRGIETE